MTFAPAPAMFLGSALGHEPADKRIEILRLIGQSGSISQAARDARVSYKAAWQAIDTLSNLAGLALVERSVGGSGGGGARLTPAAQQLLSAAALLTESRRQVLARFDGSDAAPVGKLATLPAITVRTSMRNQLPCFIHRLQVRGQVVRVHLHLSGGAALVSRITLASAELLALTKGQAVLALCKATAVQVSPSQPHMPPDAAQQLPGQVVRISRSAAGDEVSMLLDAGLQLVGFAPPGSGLKVKAKVHAEIDESAVVIALTDQL